jgi:hypothetical protein
MSQYDEIHLGCGDEHPGSFADYLASSQKFYLDRSQTANVSCYVKVWLTDSARFGSRAGMNCNHAHCHAPHAPKVINLAVFCGLRVSSRVLN